MKPAESGDWLLRLQVLAARFQGLGLGPDLAGMTMIELRAVWQFLEALAAGGRHGAKP